MIQVEIDGLLSHSSPSLFYTHGQPYCGDGVVQGYAYAAITQSTVERTKPIATALSL